MKLFLKLLVIIPILLAVGSCAEKDPTIVVEVSSTDNISQNIPVHVKIDLPSQFATMDVSDIGVTLESQDGAYKDIPGQITKDPDGMDQLWWILPNTSQDKPLKWEVSFHKTVNPATPVFKWQDEPDKHLDLEYDGRKVFRYEYELDSDFVKGETLTAKNKVFFHIFDLSGERLITNGYEDGVWSHHRGIMIGWRDVQWQDQELSLWGMEDLTTQKHIKFVEKMAGPVLAEVEAIIQWNDSLGITIIEEHRTATIFHQHSPDIMLLDFSSNLKAVNGAVSLDGDAEHAGVQYRAHNDVAADSSGSSKPVYYFHHENIDPKTDYNLPWVGMSYGLNGKTYSVVDMSGAGNPEPAIWSAYRDYGRFGAYTKKDLENGESFNVNYRFWISESGMPDRKNIDAQYKSYQDPPMVSVE